MSSEMKQKALKIIKLKLDGAEDGLWRADMQFSKMNKEELKRQYFESGKTCGEIYNECKHSRNELKDLLNWMEKVNE